MTRALIVARPWIDRILDAGKTWEMRSTRTSIRGRIGLIEAGSGLIVGEVDIVDCLEPLTPDTARTSISSHQVDDLALLEKWKHPWVLENAQRYDQPIPYHHPKGAVTWVRLLTDQLNEINEKRGR